MEITWSPWNKQLPLSLMLLRILFAYTGEHEPEPLCRNPLPDPDRIVHESKFGQVRCTKQSVRPCGSLGQVGFRGMHPPETELPSPHTANR